MKVTTTSSGPTLMSSGDDGTSGSRPGAAGPPARQAPRASGAVRARWARGRAVRTHSSRVIGRRGGPGTERPTHAATAATMAATSSGGGVGRDGPQLAGTGADGHGSEGHVAVLALGELLPLGAQHVEGPHEDPPQDLPRVDDVVDVAPLGGDVGVGEALGVLLDELGAPGLGVRRRRRSPCGR